MEYSRFPRNEKYYSGAERKFGITVGVEEYIIKFRKKERFGVRNNHISEYLGCRIIENLEFDVQKAYLGTYKGEDVVAIKDFVGEGQQFVAFNDVGESTIEEDREQFTYSYKDIMEILSLNNKLEDPEKTVRQFWELYILDALLGNFDRHGGNWGFIKQDNRYSLAPIFDNGSCIYPKLTDENHMELIINSVEETEKRIYEFPKSQILLDGKKSSYYEVINSLKYPECNEALRTVFKRFDYKQVEKIIETTECLSRVQMNFYKHMVLKRYQLILKESYERLVEHEKTGC